MLVRLHRRWRQGQLICEDGDRATLRLTLRGRPALVGVYRGVADRVRILPVDGKNGEHKGVEP